MNLKSQISIAGIYDANDLHNLLEPAKLLKLEHRIFLLANNIL